LKECNQCGKCCTKYGGDRLSVSESELEFWESFRPEIFEYVHDGEIWKNPETDTQLHQCPWLRREPTQGKYICTIYFDRPDDCKFYPVTVTQMVEDECEMLELNDLLNLKKAQTKLNLIMTDSRPPYELSVK